MEETRAKLQMLPPILLAVILLSPAVATGTPIVVENESFEQVACPADPACTQRDFGAFTIGVVPGWVSVGDSGVYNPQRLTFDLEFPSDGLQSGYANTNASLTQDGLAAIVDGVTYTLKVDVGRRSDDQNSTCCIALDFEVSLLADGSPVAVDDENAIAGGIPKPGAFGTLTLSFTGTPATAGQSLGIELASFANQTNWDDVRLDESGPGSGGQGGDPGTGAGGTGGGAGGTGESEGDSGCGCRVSPRAMESNALLALGVLAILSIRQARRKRHVR